VPAVLNQPQFAIVKNVRLPAWALCNIVVWLNFVFYICVHVAISNHWCRHIAPPARPTHRRTGTAPSAQSQPVGRGSSKSLCDNMFKLVPN